MPEFLQRLSPRLAHYYALAFRYCHEDPENSLVKLRACAVILLEELFTHYRLSRRGNLFEALNRPNIHDYLPYHIQENLNFLRVEGNKGAHPGTAYRTRQAARQTALLALKTAFKAAAWVYETLYREPPGEAFVPPQAGDSDRLYGDAVARGQADAQYSVGMMFRARSREDAVYWLGKAAAQKHPPALFQLGLLYCEDGRPEAGWALIREAAEVGEAEALYYLGCELLDRKRDYSAAFQCFSQAAEHEHLGALNRLVRMYYEGLGVAVDHDKAFEYAYQAAQAGYPSAQFKLAHLYQSGCGVDPSLAQAFHWYEKAAQAGHADAQVVLFKFYSNGLYVEKNLHAALEWLHLAEAQNHAGACYYLGLAYRRGIGVASDPVRALNLFKRCIDFDRDHQYEAAKLEFAHGVTELRALALKAATARAKNPLEHKTGRNDPCPCGSGKKYKKCCLYKE